MITLLTSELNRINQGCGKETNISLPLFHPIAQDNWRSITIRDKENKSVHSYMCGEFLRNKEGEQIGGVILCDTCQKEKETLKKVSLMWADEMLNLFDDCLDEAKEMKEIKSLIENQEDFQKLGSHEPSQMEKA
jgi:hypothetical protein